jgi:hypothetical protein
LAGYIPASVGEITPWNEKVENARPDRRNLCNALKRKGLFSNLYGTYTIILNLTNSRTYYKKC